MNKNVLLLLVSISLLISCTRDDMGLTDDALPEGEPARISLNQDDGMLKTRSGLSPTQETAINSIFVLVFDKTGAKCPKAIFPRTLLQI